MPLSFGAVLPPFDEFRNLLIPQNGTSLAPEGERERRIAMTIPIALALAALLQAPAPKDDGPHFTLGAQARLTAPDGTVTNPDYFVEEITYGDLFDAGQGFRLELGLLWSAGKDWSIGPLLAVGFDDYGGSRVTDGVGDTIDPEDLEAFSVLAGFRGVYHPAGGLVLDFRAALGAVTWSDVDALFTVGGTPIPDVSFLSGTTAFSFELGTRIGYRVGPAILDLGFAMTISGGPDRGSDVNDVIDPSAFLGLSVELGVEFVF
jgi:hypothetical protein